MDLKTTVVFQQLQNSSKRITAMQGGARSGKTYNIMQWFIVKLLKEEGKILTIVRESLPSIKGTVLRDFMDIMIKLGIYSELNHNKTENIYTLNTNIIEFVSVDQPQKIRGRKRNYLFINEANELNYDAWMQLVFRTENKIVIDYNPSEAHSYIYDHVLTRDDCDFHITTYLDNPFLPSELVNEIERLRYSDEDYYRVFGLGLRGAHRELVFTHWQLTYEMPTGIESFIGVDFGFNHPSVVLLCAIKDKQIFVDELVYESKLTTVDLANRMRDAGVKPSSRIYCDYADPRSIEELNRQGFRALPCDRKDVLEGIMKIKSMPLFITRRSTNTIKELKSYKWRTDKDGKVDDQPVKFLDDAMDAMRYAVSSHLAKPVVNWAAF